MTTERSPRGHLHGVVLGHWNSEALLEDWDAWSEGVRAAHEGTVAACPEVGGDSR